jgi:hypothetical protein
MIVISFLIKGAISNISHFFSQKQLLILFSGKWLAFEEIKSTTMKINIGQRDKTTRLVAAVIIPVVYFFELLTGTVATLLLVLAVMLILTSLISFCPIYSLLNIKTSKTKQSK